MLQVSYLVLAEGYSGADFSIWSLFELAARLDLGPLANMCSEAA